MRKFGFPRQFMHKDYACLLTFSFFVELTFTFVFSVFMWFILLFQSARTMRLLYISSHSVKKFHTWFETRKFLFFSIVSGLPLNCCKRSKWPTMKSFCQIMRHKIKESNLFHRGQRAKCRVPTIYSVLHKRRRWLKITRERKSWRNWQYIHHAR